MAKYNGPVCRLCRRESQKLFLKGERCYTDKCSYDRRDYGPGTHGQKRTKGSEYALQLREKQKVKRVYGMMEKPFRNLYKKSFKKKGITSEIFFNHLEKRLDNVVYRMGFAGSRQAAKQNVRHNHILLNGKRANIPSITVRVGDEISVVNSAADKDFIKNATELAAKRPSLPWLEVDYSKKTGKVIAEPTRDDIGMPVKERLIVELYSK